MDGLPSARCPDSTVLLRQCSAVPPGLFAPVRDRTTEQCSPSCSPTAWLSRVWMTLSPPQGWVGEKVIDKK